MSLTMIKSYAETGGESYIVWSAIDNCFHKLRGLLADSSSGLRQAFNDFICASMAKVADSVGWVPQGDEDHLRGLLRMMVLMRLGGLGHPVTCAEAKRRFENHFTNKERIPADLRSIIYRSVAAAGGADVFEQLKTLHRQGWESQS